MSQSSANTGDASAASPPGDHRARRRRRVGRVWYVLLLLLALCAAGTSYLLRDPTPRFVERRSHLVAASESPAEPIDGHSIRHVHLTAASGLEVDLLVKQPTEDSAARQPDVRRPLVVLLGGHVTGRDAVKLIPATRGAVVASLSYPFKGDTRLKGLSILPKVPKIRGALLDTPPALMLALDYLLAQPGIDSSRVEGVGVSLGAPFVVIAGAMDPRFTRVWAIHGSGGSYTPLEHNMRRNIRVAPLRVPLAALATVVIAGPRLAPERWAPRIAPRPFVMINATADERIPRSSAEQLFASAREPKDIIWVPGRHVRARPEVVRQLVDMVLDRIVGAGLAPERRVTGTRTSHARSGRVNSD
jgi:fermentation-respiration switch protein FrsA (DUF1100 family)